MRSARETDTSAAGTAVVMLGLAVVGLALIVDGWSWQAASSLTVLLGGASLALVPLALSTIVPDVETLAPLIAVIGCDGAGKSTLSHDLVGWLRRDRRAAHCYLGLGSGDIGERIKRWPLVGRAVEAKLATKAAQTRTAGETIPGLATALVIYGFSLARRRRFRRMLALRRSGVTVVTDRYPQVDVAGFYDGPGLSAAGAGSPLVAWLAARERRMYVAMADHRPDLVIRLNIDVATAFDRKPDHKLGSLEAKVAATPRLRFNGAPIADLDSTAPYSAVSGAARTLVCATLERQRVASQTG